MQATHPNGLKPEHASHIDQPLGLYRGPCVLRTRGGDIPGHGDLRYAWLPSGGPELTFQAALPTNRQEFDDDYTVVVTALGLEARLVPRSISHAGTPQLVGMLSGTVRFGDPSALRSLRFHVANFHEVLGDWIVHGDWNTRGRTVFEHDGWCLVLDAVPDDRRNGGPTLQQRIQEARGHAITHTGQLTRIDGGPFSADEADPVLQDLGRTLSFARGAFTHPFLLSGHDAAGTCVWRCWSPYSITRWEGGPVWFSGLAPEILPSVFAGFRRLRASADAEVINAALHLYLDAHVQPLALESGLVLAQSALEGLASGWQLGNAGPPSAGVTAAGRIAAVVTSLGLPLSVPAAFQELAALQNPAANATALEKMTWVRNSIAHLGNIGRLANKHWRVKYEARELALWYLELALLRLLDAEGRYLDRVRATRVADVDRLPWKV